MIRSEADDRCWLIVRAALCFVMGFTRGKGLTGELKWPPVRGKGELVG